MPEANLLKVYLPLVFFTEMNRIYVSCVYILKFIFFEVESDDKNTQMCKVNFFSKGRNKNIASSEVFFIKTFCGKIRMSIGVVKVIFQNF